MIGLVLLVLFVGLPVLLIVAAVSARTASAPTRKLVGGIMLAIGVLIATGSGLCSAAMLLSGGANDGLTVFIVVIGGLPFAGGVGLVFWGRSLIRSARPLTDRELGRRFD